MIKRMKQIILFTLCFFFVQGMKEILTKQEVKTLLSYFDTNPYCADISLSIHSRLSSENLKDCGDFIKILHKLTHEELGAEK